VLRPVNAHQYNGDGRVTEVKGGTGKGNKPGVAFEVPVSKPAGKGKGEVGAGNVTITHKKTGQSGHEDYHQSYNSAGGHNGRDDKGTCGKGGKVARLDLDFVNDGKGCKEPVRDGKSGKMSQVQDGRDKMRNGRDLEQDGRGQSRDSRDQVQNGRDLELVGRDQVRDIRSGETKKAQKAMRHEKSSQEAVALGKKN
jgi:hypothetical protein